MGWLVRRSRPTSLRSQPLIPPVPADTLRTAHAAFQCGNPCLMLRDEFGAMFSDADFADLYPKRGQPAYAPWRLALVTLMQFREGLSDRQAAEAVRARIDLKYLLGLEFADSGFDHSVLCEFRGRLLTLHAEERLLSRVLDGARSRGLLRARTPAYGQHACAPALIGIEACATAHHWAQAAQTGRGDSPFSSLSQRGAGTSLTMVRA